jgi:hypothetical protein
MFWGNIKIDGTEYKKIEGHIDLKIGAILLKQETLKMQF